MAQTEFDMPNFVLRLVLNKAFEAGRKRGKAETRPTGYHEPDFEEWYRKELKLDKPESG